MVYRYARYTKIDVIFFICPLVVMYKIINLLRHGYAFRLVYSFRLLPAKARRNSYFYSVDWFDDLHLNFFFVQTDHKATKANPINYLAQH